jgi:hypothetical protein
MTEPAEPENERPARAEHSHWGPKTKFSVDRSTPKLTFDAIEGQRITHGQDITIHWPEMEEARIVYVEITVDRHGTEHNRAYFEIIHLGAIIKIYLRDIHSITSIQLNRNRIVLR